MATASFHRRAPSCRVKPQAASRFAALCAELERDDPLPPEQAAAIQQRLAQAPYAQARQGELELPA